MDAIKVQHNLFISDGPVTVNKGWHVLGNEN